MGLWGEGVNGHEEGIEGVDIVQLRVSSSSYIYGSMAPIMWVTAIMLV